MRPGLHKSAVNVDLL